MKKNQSLWREIFRVIHLWLGLASGIILFIVCLTGTVLVYEHEIIDFYSEKVDVAAHAGKEKLTLEQLKAVVEQKQDRTVTGVSYSDAHPEKVTFSLKPEEGQRRGKRIALNAFTGEELAQSKAARAFMLGTMKLHRWLLLDIEIGRPIVGIATIIFIIISFTGLGLWLPKKLKSWKQGFKVKWSGSFYRVNYDLHNTLGFYTLIFALIMAFSGLFWSFDGYRKGLQTVLSVTRSESPKPSKLSGTHSLSFDTISTLVAQKLPYEGEVSISHSRKPGGAMTVYKKPNSWYKANGYDKIYLHPQNGEVIGATLFADLSLGNQIYALIKGIHIGSVFGGLSKLLYFISCLIMTSFPITGTIIWLKKKK